MDLREAVDRYANAVSSRDYWDNLKTRKKELDIATSACEETGRLLDALIGMADAAVAYMEHQATNVYDPDDCDLKYAQQRAKMWDAFIVARAKVKGANDGST